MALASTISRNDPAQFGVQQKMPTGNLNTPEYYQEQRNQMAGQTGLTALPTNDFASQRSQMAPVVGLNQTPAPAPTDSALGPMPDAGAIQRRLLGSVPGATDLAGMPYNQGFDTGVQNLYAGEMGKLNNLNLQEGDINTAYEKNRSSQLQGQDLAMKQLMDRLAFQGILSSGITTDQRALLGQRYSDILDRLASARANALRGIAGQRVGIQGEYQTKLGDLESAYVKNVSDWVQQQAQQQAQRQQQQAVDQANANLLQQLQQMQANYYGQMSGAQLPPLSPVDASGNPIDWAAVAEAVRNGMNLPPGWRPPA